MFGLGLKTKGVFTLTHVRNGVIKKVVTSENTITREGLHRGFDAFFRGLTTTWSVGLINTGVTGSGLTDTMASHTGWTVAAYTTPTLTPVTFAAVDFTVPATPTVEIDRSTYGFGARLQITTAGSIGGVFLCSSDGLSLWSVTTSGYTSQQGSFTVAIGDYVYVSYKVSTSVAGFANSSTSIIFNVGRYYYLVGIFNQVAPSSWRSGLISTLTPTFVNTQTYASHATWSDSGLATALTTWEAAGITQQFQIWSDISTKPGPQFTFTSNLTVGGAYVYAIIGGGTQLFGAAIGVTNNFGTGKSFLNGDTVFIEWTFEAQ